MKKLFVLIALVALVLPILNTNSQAKPKSEKIPQGHAKLIFERESRFVSAAVSSRIRIKGNKLASMFSGGREVAYYKAGRHEIEVDHWLDFGPGSKLKVNLKSGKTYRFLITVRSIHIYSGPSVVPAASKTHKNGYFSSGYFDIKLVKGR